MPGVQSVLHHLTRIRTLAVRAQRVRKRRRAAAFDAVVRDRLDARARAAEDLAQRFGPEAALYLGLRARLMWQAGDARRAAEAEDQVRHLAALGG